MIGFVAVLTAVLVSSPLVAATRTWTGAFSNAWQDPANWSPNGLPAPEDDVMFPAGAANTSVNTGAFLQDPTVQSVSFGASYTIGGVARLHVASGISVTAGGAHVRITSVETTGPNVWTVENATLQTDVAILGSSSLDVTGTNGTLVVNALDATGNVTARGVIVGGRIDSFNGTLDVDDLQVHSADAGGTVIAKRFVGDGEFNNLIVTELIEPTHLIVAANLMVGVGSAPAEYRGHPSHVAHLYYTSSATLGQQVSLSLTPAFGEPADGESYALIEARNNAAPVNGTFLGLPEGAQLTIGDHLFHIAYQQAAFLGPQVILNWAGRAGARTWTGAASSLWSNPANWSPAGVPPAGQDLVFPANAPLTSVNDLPGAFTPGKMWLEGPYNIQGNGFVLEHGLEGTATFANDIDLGADQTFDGSFTFNGVFDVSGQVLRCFTCIFNGPLTGTGTLRGRGDPANIWIQAPSNDFQGELIETRLALNGSLPSASMSGAQADSALTVGGGEQTIGDVEIAAMASQSAGLVLDHPLGPEHGLVHTGSFRLEALFVFLLGHPTFHLDVGASSSDRVDAHGTVTLGSGTAFLHVNVVEPPAEGQVFTFIENDGTDPVSGHFVLGFGFPPPTSWEFLTEGTVFTRGGVTFRISYTGGDGNDVTLTVLETVPQSIATATAIGGNGQSVAGDAVTFDVSVQPAPSGGTVMLRIDGQDVATLQLINGAASFTTSTLGVGMHTVVAHFSGVDNFAASNSETVTHTVTKIPTAVAASLSQPFATVGVPFIVTVGVDPALATGGVVIFDGNDIVGGGRLGDEPLPIAVTFTRTGHHALTIVYEGDARYEPSTATLDLQVLRAAKGRRRAVGRR